MVSPAASCPRCSKPGTPSLDQRSHSGTNSTIHGGPLEKRMRFHCSCGTEWLTDRDDAQLHGRFLNRAGIAP